MKYNLEINGETDALLVEQKDGGGMVITAAGKQRTVTACRIDADRLVLNVDGAIRNVFLGGNDAAKQIVIDGVAYGVADADAKAMAAATGTDRKNPGGDPAHAGRGGQGSGGVWAGCPKGRRPGGGFRHEDGDDADGPVWRTGHWHQCGRR